MSGVDLSTVGAVRLWWPTPVLMRRYQPEPGEDLARGETPRLRDWLAAAGRDLLAELARTGDTLPTLTLVMDRTSADPAGAVPRRAPGAVLAGVFSLEPAPDRSPMLTFLDPRSGAEMVPGTSAPADTVQSLSLPWLGLVLCPGWLPHGHQPLGSGPGTPWLKLRFMPPAFARGFTAS